MATTRSPATLGIVSGALSVPATVTVPAGPNSISFAVTSLYAGTSTKYVDINASYGGASALVTVALSKTGAGG